MLRIVVATAALVLAVLPARADPVAEFYKGQQIKLIVGYGTGGGYDVYGRLFARHLGRHIPGQSDVIVQNMPGAGSLRAINFLANSAPKDGTTIATFSARHAACSPSSATTPMCGSIARKLTWLGSSSSYANDAYFLFVRKDAAVQSIDDARRPGGPPLVLGGTAEGSTGNDVAMVLRSALGLNIRLIPGYPDSAGLFLAVDRRRSRWPLRRALGDRVVASAMARARRATCGCCCSSRASRGIRISPTCRPRASLRPTTRRVRSLRWPNCPTGCRGRSPHRPAFRRIGRKALQAAFLAVHHDPLYREDAARLKVDISPIGGHDVMRAIDDIAGAPADMLDVIGKIMSDAKGGGEVKR